MPTIKISVRDFAKPLIKSGSLKLSSSPLGMELLGSKIHQKIAAQNSCHPSYAKEVPYQLELIRKNFKLKLSGRADGVYTANPLVIEEIKSTFHFSRLISELQKDSNHPYILQLKTYLFIHHLKTPHKAKGRLLLVSLRDSREEKLNIPYLTDEFSIYFYERFDQLIKEYQLQKKTEQRRKNISKQLSFPFQKKRLHQKQLLQTVDSLVTSGKQGLIQAPTGIGKTIAMLYPSLKNSLARGAPLYYTTPKNSQFSLVEDSAEKISRATKKNIRIFTLTSKSKICLNNEVICDENYCPYAKDYYKKLAESEVLIKLSRKQKIGPKVLRRLAEEFMVCPYYLGFESIKDFDIIIGDYNYFFGPKAILSNLLANRSKKSQPNLLIDEAHNLYERGLEYYSPQLQLNDLMNADKSPKIPLQCDKNWTVLKHNFLTLFKNHRPMSIPSVISLDTEKIMKIFLAFTEFIFSEFDALKDHPGVLNLYYNLAEFNSIAKGHCLESKSAYLASDKGEAIAIICCDPSAHLQAAFDKFHSTIGFSATLKPFAFYKKLSGFKEDAYFEEFDTPFPEQNRKLLIIPQVSTAYRDRHNQFEKIAHAIILLASESKGHYFAFLPSYHFLNQLKKHLEGQLFNVFFQTPNMSPKDQKKLLDLLYEKNKCNLILAVQGSLLSEGLDIHSPSLKGVFVIGPALPLKSFERDLRSQYYKKAFGDGFAYAYIYPAMTRSIQAAGRVIRSENKKGLIVLMDKRFIQPLFVETMPRFWYKKSIMERVERGLLTSVKTFWSKSLPKESEENAPS